MDVMCVFGVVAQIRFVLNALLDVSLISSHLQVSSVFIFNFCFFLNFW